MKGGARVAEQDEYEARKREVKRAFKNWAQTYSAAHKMVAADASAGTGGKIPDGLLCDGRTEAMAELADISLRIMLASLTWRQRQVIWLKYFLQVTEGRIGDHFRISQPAVSQICGRAMKKIYKSFFQGGYIFPE